MSARDVLRYWLASVRLEESLKVRPRARKHSPGNAVPRLDQPSAGQPYFKLPLSEVAQLMLEDAAVERGFDAELAAYFEGWLLQQYRRGADDGELAHVLCFPVVHLPRGELAGLLRRGVKLRFDAPGTSFRVPTRSERQRGDLPPAPTRVSVGCGARNDESWPFFVDTRLLSYPLGVASERIDALFESMRARGSLSEREMLEMVASTLEDALRDLGESSAAAEPLPRLLTAMQRLLRRSPMRAEAYPVGIVVDGTQAKTTWHLQRELASLDDELEGPLRAYLTGTPAPPGDAPQRALFTGPPLTSHQRSAAERFWGSSLTAVQGPPGTGKTTLILHVCAESLVRQVDALLDRQSMGAELLLIASGNNRAVDNVIDPLARARSLPLALRVGSRQVCEQQLSAQLRATLGWLGRAKAEPEALRTSAYAAALGAYTACRDAVDGRFAPRRAASERNAERARIDAELATLPVVAPGPSASAVLAPLRKVIKRLGALSELCAAKPTMAHVNAVARHYEKTAARDLPALEQAMHAAGLALDVPLPPLATPLEVGALLEAWEEGAESFLEDLTALQDRLARAEDDERRAAVRRVLEKRRATLGDAEQVPDVEQDDAASSELFALALNVREAWAKVHANELHDAIDEAARCVEQERSLRPLFRDAPSQARLLCQLFGVWGSTLLSLGNCLPADPGVVARVILDEAGQCHPAHAVSALLRADSALLIGDVYQLPPVIELSPDDDLRLLRSLRPKVDTVALEPYRVHGASEVSAQSLADRAVSERLTLVDHFRCQPAIIAVSDRLCRYGLRMHVPAVDQASRASGLQHPLTLRDLRGEQQRFAGSLHNELELSETLHWVARLLARGVAPADIAVITPYRGQLDRLRRGLLEQRVPLEQSVDDEGELFMPRVGLALGTVHRFQGGERSIVLFSSVITEPRSLGFLNDRPNLLNVAVSRAQQHFVCLGHREVLLQGARTRVLVQAATEIAISTAP